MASASARNSLRRSASGDLAEPEIDALARSVEADQQIEIDRMRKLLAPLPAGDVRRQSAG
jgi:uncharacterized protein (DUF305 family)